MTETLAAEHVRRVYASYAGLYGQTCVQEAARLLDALADTAAEHGQSRADALGALARYAADAVSRQYGRPKQERTVAEVTEMTKALRDALHEAGLTTTMPAVPVGTAVDPVPGGPSWGWDGKTGLAVALYLDSGWEMTVNQSGTRALVSVYAPATKEGARDVAELVRGVLHGEIPDPFRRTR